MIYKPGGRYLGKPVDFDKFTGLMDDFGFYGLGWNHKPWI